MKKINFLTLLLIFLTFSISPVVFSQGTGIGTKFADSSAALDVVNTNAGVLIPRISNVATSIPKPANGLLVYDLDKQCLSQNTGTPNAPNWVAISGNVVKFFYMPSVALDITKPTGNSYDLFDIYKKQFSTPRVMSAGAPAAIPFFAESTDLYYYITHYSDLIFHNVKVSSEGILTYDVNLDALTNSDRSDFMNIVLVVK
ncbi:hypothetical protein OIU80_20290 [Flavobacterium sp. LS1R47]|uniref:Uncharacterized protein n=1 Tax=Flavobacterium frigoritolerans TaxID=2987686 RepID=A0A9X3HNP6_9FLAO|nr:hypothetical protein [Flavobacterium frigoritolerans]MCV9934629.1 hypothetical protein [Flavobacterium frigoritolerans]